MAWELVLVGVPEVVLQWMHALPPLLASHVGGIPPPSCPPPPCEAEPCVTLKYLISIVRIAMLHDAC